MTLSEIMDWVRMRTKGLDIETQDLIREINVAHAYIARELRIPQRVDNIVVTPNKMSVVASIAGFRELNSVFDITNNRKIDVFRNRQELQAVHPTWREDTFNCPLVFVDQAESKSSLYTAGFSEAVTLELRFLNVLSVLANPTDEPFGGVLPEYHRLIPLRVSSEYLIYTGNSDAEVIRGRQARADFNNEIRWAFSRLAPTWTEGNYYAI